MLRYMEVLLATHPSKQRRCFQSLNIHASGIGLLQRCSSLESWHAHCVSLLILKLRPSCYHKKNLNRNKGTGLLTSEVSTAIFAFHKELQSQLLGHKLGLVETVIEHWCLHRALYKHRCVIQRHSGAPRLQVYEKNHVLEKFFEYPLEVNITVRLVQGFRPGFPNKAEVVIDGQPVWSSQKEMALPTRAHIGMPRGHRYPVKCRRYSPMATTYKGPGVYPLNSCVPVIRDAGVLCALDIVRTSSSDSFVGIHHIIIII